MNVITMDVTQIGCVDSPLLIGYAGENSVEAVDFDFTSWAEDYGAGTITLEIMRASDTAPYTPLLTIDDTTARWTISDVDTARRGPGVAQLIYTPEGSRKKSAVFKFYVGKSIRSDDDTDPWQDLLNRLEELLGEMQQQAADTRENAEAADQSAQAAASSESNAEAWAVGERGGDPVPASDPTFKNNAKYYAGLTAASETAAEEAAAAAAQSESNAAASAAGASQSQASAAASETAAAGSATAAASSAAAAQDHATSAASSATVASGSATAARDSGRSAAASASAAAQSEDDAAAYATGAAQSAASATASKNAAAGSASSAATSAAAAQSHATSAGASATAASGSASAAAQSATEAGNASTAATTAKEAAEDAQESAEALVQSIAQSAEQIAQNTADIGTLKSQITVEQGIIKDGYFQLLSSNFEKSEWRSTGTKSSASRTICYKEKIPVKAGDKLITKANPLYIGWYLVADGTAVEKYYTSSGNRYVLSDTEFVFQHDGDLLINIGTGNRYASSASISPSDMTATLYAQISLAGRLMSTTDNLLTAVNNNELNYVNLAGMEANVLYPVNIPANTPITMSTADGTVYGSSNLNLHLYDANKNYLNSFNFSQSVANRTITWNTDVKYLSWGVAPTKLVQVEIGNRASPYKPYYYPVGKRLAEIESNVDSFVARGIFNGEPYAGIYDWQTQAVNYGVVFKGKANVETFAFFTDPHVMGFGDSSRNELNMHEYIKKTSKVLRSVPCKFAVCGGDWLNNSTTMDEACYRLGYIKALSNNMLCDCKLVIGNHDTNYQGKLDAESENGTGRLTNATIAALMFNDTETRKAYYSFDGIRSKCYVLDSGIEHNTMLEYDWEQIAWLTEKLTEDDPTHAIIFLHIIVNGGNIQTNATNFGALVEAYNSHATVTLNGATYDFTSCSGHVDFWVAGHTHVDSNGTLGGIPYFITASNGYQSDVPLIDLVLADYDNNLLYLKRVGGTGDDRTISLTTGELVTE